MATANGRLGLMRTLNLRLHQRRTQVHPMSCMSLAASSMLTRLLFTVSSHDGGLDRMMLQPTGILDVRPTGILDYVRWEQLCVHARQPGGDRRCLRAPSSEHNCEQQRPWQRRRRCRPSSIIKQPLCSSRLVGIAAGYITIKRAEACCNQSVWSRLDAIGSTTVNRLQLKHS